jgi:CRP-like cAMP-binding protein
MLSDEARSALFQLGVRRVVANGDVLIREQDDSAHVILLCQAVVKVTASLENGRAALLGIMVSGDVVGEMAALSNSPRCATVTACGHAIVRMIPRNEFLDYLKKFPDAHFALTLSERKAHGVGRPPLRLRVAMHYGTLTQGRFGPVGQAPIVVSRLLDARIARRALAESTERDLVLIVSANLYHDVVETGFYGLDATRFSPVRVTVKGATYCGYLDTPKPASDQNKVAERHQEQQYGPHRVTVLAHSAPAIPFCNAGPHDGRRAAG